MKMLFCYLISTSPAQLSFSFTLHPNLFPEAMICHIP